MKPFFSRLVSFLGSGSVGDDDLWSRHILGMLLSVPLFLSPSLPGAPSWLVIPLCTFQAPKICMAGQSVLLSTAGSRLSFLSPSHPGPPRPSVFLSGCPFFWAFVSAIWWRHTFFASVTKTRKMEATTIGRSLDSTFYYFIDKKMR